MQTLGLQFALQMFLPIDNTTRRDPLPERLTLASFGWGDVSLAPKLGEPREQSKEFKPFSKSNLYYYLNYIV
jgi:hypothetical protein